MSYILCLETSTTNCSVAVSNNGILLSLVEEDSNKFSHAEKLHLFIEKALNIANVNKKDLEAVAVSKGPGSYTGLRIGVSAAKGLAYSLDIPLISVSTLHSLALKAKKNDFIVPMIDARRMEVYTQTFNSEFMAQNIIEAKVLDQNSFSDLTDNGAKVSFIGNGVEKFKAIYKSSNQSEFIPANPSAREMLTIANNKNKQQLYEDVAYFEPFYLKDFVAGR